jgi:hypothetical protein
MRFVGNADSAHLRKLQQKVTDQTESFCPPLSLFPPVDILGFGAVAARALRKAHKKLQQ